MNNMQNHPLETVEADSGVLIRQYDLRPDSGGPGRWRGGAAGTCTIEIVRDGGAIYGTGMENIAVPDEHVLEPQFGQMLKVHAATCIAHLCAS